MTHGYVDSLTFKITCVFYFAKYQYVIYYNYRKHDTILEDIRSLQKDLLGDNLKDRQVIWIIHMLFYE